jgi:hypothetical protein
MLIFLYCCHHHNTPSLGNDVSLEHPVSLTAAPGTEAVCGARACVVTFLRAEDAAACLRAHDTLPCSCKKQRFYGQQLNARRAKEPSDYIWASFTFDKCEKAKRYLHVAVASLIMLTVDYWVMYFASKADLELLLVMLVSLGLAVFNQVTKGFIVLFAGYQAHCSISSKELSMLKLKMLVEIVHLVVIPWSIFGLPHAWNKPDKPDVNQEDW